MILDDIDRNKLRVQLRPCVKGWEAWVGSGRHGGLGNGLTVEEALESAFCAWEVDRDVDFCKPLSDAGRNERLVGERRQR